MRVRWNAVQLHQDLLHQVRFEEQAVFLIFRLQYETAAADFSKPQQQPAEADIDVPGFYGYLRALPGRQLRAGRTWQNMLESHARGPPAVPATVLKLYSFKTGKTPSHHMTKP